MGRAEREAARLLEMIRQAGAPVSEKVVFTRTYAGRHQRSAGAWGWFLLTAEGYDVHIGSATSRRELLRRGVVVERDHAGDWHVSPAS